MLVVNAGSSSLKLRLLGSDDTLMAERDLPATRGAFDGARLGEVLREMPAPDVVGHRVVHGGTRFRSAVRVDADVLAELRSLVDLAPLHQPKSLAALEAVSELLPAAPAVACFDTAFHAGMPAAAATYALPAVLRARHHARRFGFHGLSHAYAARRAAALLGAGVRAQRLVTCHLGAGASLAAVSEGRSLDTTMGFTPLEGLVMATRSGSVDPGLVLWLLEHTPMSVRELAATLEHDSGLRGLAGSEDMREVLARARSGEQDAALALAVYLHRLRAGIAAMAAAMDGLDALVFTGGVGENAPDVRAGAAAGLSFLGVALDLRVNASLSADAEIGAADAAVRCVVVQAREDLEIARQVRELLGP